MCWGVGMKQQRNIPYMVACYFCLFMVVFVLSSMTPMVAHEFSYCYSWFDDSRIKSIGQIIDSMAVHRVLTNGRVVVHGLVQFVLIFPKVVFNILNGLNVVFLAFMFSRCFGAGSGRRTAALLALGAVMLWNYTPAFGQVFLWLDGAINYSWTVSCCLLFLLPFIKEFLDGSKRPGWLLLIAYIPLSFAFGTCAEAYVPATLVAAAVLAMMVWLRDKRFPAEFLVWAIFAIAGYLFLLSAPAVATRTGGGDVTLMAATLKKIIADTKEMLLPLYVIYAGALALSQKSDRRKLILSLVLVGAGIVSLGMYTAAAYFAERHFLYAVVMTVLALLILVDELLRNGKKDFTALLAAAMTVLFCFNLAQGLMDITVIYAQSRQREQIIAQAKTEGQRELALQRYVASTKYSAPYKLDDLMEEPDVWPNISVAIYYGLDSVTGYMP